MRVIGFDGKQIGVMSKEEAIAKAREAEMDLVEISQNAKPPVVKIVDFSKFKYQEEKKEKEARKHTKETELKEVRLSPFIGEHDLNTGLERAKKFLLEGDLVKISVHFKGRQMAHTEFGPKLMARVMSVLSDFAEQDREGRFEGRRYVTIVRPKKGILNKKQETENKKQEQDSKETQSD